MLSENYQQRFEGLARVYGETEAGGLGLIAALGSELKREGRLAVGQLTTLYSGQSSSTREAIYIQGGIHHGLWQV